VVFDVGCCRCCPGLPESGTDRGAERLGHRWREGVSDLAVGGRLAAGDLPGIGEALQPRYHADGQFGQAPGREGGSGDVVGDTQPIDPEFLPGGAGAGGAQVGPAVLLAAPHDGRGDLAGLA
jgi:hypothetical protein